MSLRRFLSVLAAFALATATLCAAVQPSLADDEDEEPNFMSKLLGSVGLLQLPGPQINYQERPPLVVPPLTNYVQPNVPPTPDLVPSARPQQDPWNFNAPPPQNLPPVAVSQPQQSVVLPTPVETNSPRLRNPDFPVDPEVRAAQKKKKKPRMFSRAEDDPSYSGRTLTPDEMKSQGPLTRSKGSGTDATANQAQSSVQELKVPVIGNLLRTKQQEERLEFTGEPERQSLTQPPAGYLTPSKNAPYGVVAKDRQKDTTRLVHPNMPDYSGPIPTR